MEKEALKMHSEVKELRTRLEKLENKRKKSFDNLEMFVIGVMFGILIGYFI